jgi:hypothetical protein
MVPVFFYDRPQSLQISFTVYTQMNIETAILTKGFVMHNAKAWMLFTMHTQMDTETTLINKVFIIH